LAELLSTIINVLV